MKMKIKLVIITGCLIVLTSYYAPQMAYACNSCEYNCSCTSQYRNCGGWYSENCQCSDPACFQCTTCMSHEKCCRAFGNIGAA